MALNLHSTIFGLDPAEGCLSHLNNSNRYYETGEGKIVLEQCYKLLKHHSRHLKEMHQKQAHGPANY